MVKTGLVVGGVIAIIGAALGIFYGFNLMTTKDLTTIFNPKTSYALIVVVASAVAAICSSLLLRDKLSVVSSLIVLIWGFLLLLAFGGGNLALIAALLEIIGGLIGLITSIAT